MQGLFCCVTVRQRESFEQPPNVGILASGIQLLLYSKIALRGASCGKTGISVSTASILSLPPIQNCSSKERQRANFRGQRWMSCPSPRLALHDNGGAYSAQPPRHILGNRKSIIRFELFFSPAGARRTLFKFSPCCNATVRRSLGTDIAGLTSLLRSSFCNLGK